MAVVSCFCVTVLTVFVLLCLALPTGACPDRGRASGVVHAPSFTTDPHGGNSIEYARKRWASCIEFRSRQSLEFASGRTLKTTSGFPKLSQDMRCTSWFQKFLIQSQFQVLSGKRQNRSCKHTASILRRPQCEFGFLFAGCKSNF